MAKKETKRFWTLSELAREAQGELDGDGEIRISGVAGIEEAGEGEIAFVANPKYLSALEGTRASAVILGTNVPSGIPAIRCKNPYLAFARVATLMQPRPSRPFGVSPDLVQGKGCRLGKDLSVYPRVVLGDRVEIGDRVTLFPGVVLGDDSIVGSDSVLHASVSVRERVVIGRRVIIHSGAVVGSDGFGFAPDGDRYFKIPQMGGVRIGDHVEIGANTTVDRGTLGDTVIGEGTKIDNLVQIAHNVVIGRNCIIVSQVGISGSTVIGDHVTLAGQVGVAGHLRIGDGVVAGAQSGITKDIPRGRMVAGLPAIRHRDWLKAAGSFVHLPEIRRTLTRLQQQVEELMQKLSGGTNDDGDR